MPRGLVSLFIIKFGYLLNPFINLLGVFLLPILSQLLTIFVTNCLPVYAYLLALTKRFTFTKNNKLIVSKIKQMKTILPYLICIVLGLLLARECNRDKTDTNVITITKTIPIPPISGWFEPKTDLKPVLVHKVDSTYKEYYLTAKDSLERLQMYLDAITIREYKEQFKDSVQEVNVFTKVRGEMLAQSLDYKIFERSVTQTDTIEIKKKRHLYLVPQAGYNYNTFEIKAGASLLYIDRKKRLYSLGYDTSGFINVGYGLKW